MLRPPRIKCDRETGIEYAFIRKESTKIGPRMISGLFANPNTLEMEKLKELGFSTCDNADHPAQHNVQTVQTYIIDIPVNT